MLSEDLAMGAESLKIRQTLLSLFSVPYERWCPILAFCKACPERSRRDLIFAITPTPPVRL